MPNHIHPPTDLPREELMALAAETLQQYPSANIYFKFTCQHCGTRCTLQTPNLLHESGICFECERETPILHGGFMIAMEAA